MRHQDDIANFILSTIFTGQGHISKVLVIPEFSKCQVHVFLEIILLKYFFLKFFEPCIYFSGLLRPNRTGLNSGLNQTDRRQLVPFMTLYNDSCSCTFSNYASSWKKLRYVILFCVIWRTFHTYCRSGRCCSHYDLL